MESVTVDRQKCHMPHARGLTSRASATKDVAAETVDRSKEKDYLTLKKEAEARARARARAEGPAEREKAEKLLGNPREERAAIATLGKYAYLESAKPLFKRLLEESAGRETKLAILGVLANIASDHAGEHRGECGKNKIVKFILDNMHDRELLNGSLEILRYITTPQKVLDSLRDREGAGLIKEAEALAAQARKSRNHPLAQSYMKAMDAMSGLYWEIMMR